VRDTQLRRDLAQRPQEKSEADVVLKREMSSHRLAVIVVVVISAGWRGSAADSIFSGHR
jgi:hypothetical protein